jgi:hypothetical protein
MHWCLGMYASGSTWLYNAVRMVGATLFPEAPIVGGFLTQADEIPADPGDRQLAIVKTHDTAEAAALQLGQQSKVIWLSIRDPRDCVTSLMKYQLYDFDEALDMVAATALFCQRFVGQAQTSLLRYENGFCDDPVTLDRIAGGFGKVLSAEQRGSIHQALRRSSIEHHIRQMDALPTALQLEGPEHIVDTATQWHTHHANRTGEVGRWRHMLTAPQTETVEHRLGDWMVAFDYRLGTAQG